MNDNYNYIDLSYLELMSDGDQQMKSILLELLLNEPVGQIEQMNQYMEEKNWKDLQFLAHKLKSSFPYTGYNNLIDKNVELDSILKASLDGKSFDGFEAKVTTALAAINQHYKEALPELEDAYNKVANTV